MMWGCLSGPVRVLGPLGAGVGRPWPAAIAGSSQRGARAGGRRTQRPSHARAHSNPIHAERELASGVYSIGCKLTMDRQRRENWYWLDKGQLHNL